MSGMTFHEWMKASEQIIGKEGCEVLMRFAGGEISFEECLKAMYEVMPPENMDALVRFMERTNP